MTLEDKTNTIHSVEEAVTVLTDMGVPMELIKPPEAIELTAEEVLDE